MDVHNVKPLQDETLFSHTINNAPESVLTEVTVDHGKEALKDISFGSIAGVAGKFVEYPFDTVKVRLQSQPDYLPLRYTGPVDCFRQSFRQDGFLGLYRGVSAPLLGAAIETSCLFFSYRVFQQLARSTIYTKDTELSLTSLTACGALSGTFTSFALTPIELIKCKMQVPLEHNATAGARPGIASIIGSVWRHQGIKGFWRGQTGTLLRETGGSAAWFGSYESVSAFFRSLKPKTTTSSDTNQKTPLPVYQQMLAGAAAGMGYNFAFYPADTIKSRMQTEEITPATRSKSTFWTVGRAIYAQHGLKGLYRGCGITVGRAAPSSALIFTIYDSLRTNFG